MSYILDAIKKAETQRQADQIPTFESSVMYADHNTKIPWKWVALLLLAIIIVVLGVLVSKPVLNFLSKGSGALVHWVDDLITENKLLNPGSPEKISQTANVAQPSSSNQSNNSSTVDTENDSLGVALSSMESQSQSVNPSIAAADLVVLEKIRLSVISYSSYHDKRFVMYGADILREGDSIQGFQIVTINKNSVLVDVKGVGYEIRL